MPTDAAQLIELLGRFAIDPDMTGHLAPTGRSHPRPIGTWTIDPTLSSVSLAWRKLRLWTMTGWRPCVGSSTLMSCLRLGSSVQPADVSCMTKRVS
jgi:hypothetical protein